MRAGALGYLPKSCSVKELTQAIRKAYVGQMYIHPDVAQQLAMQQIDGQEDSPIEQLSERELQVMLRISAGEAVPSIAEKLCVTTKTINTYRYRLFEKLGVTNDVALTHLAIKFGLLDRDNLLLGDAVADAVG